MSFTVVTPDYKPLITLWQEYCAERGYTPEVLAPMEGELLTLELAARRLGQGVFGYKTLKIPGIFVFPVGGEDYQGRIVGEMISPEVPKPGVKPKFNLGKYFKPSGSSNRVYIPKHRTDWYNRDNKYNLIICEGALNANALNAAGFYAVAIAGIWSFNIGNKNTPMIPELKRLLELPNVERVTLMPDSDTANPEERPDLWVAVNRLAAAITKVRKDRSDTLFTCRPPDREDGGKNGPDDYLFNKGADEFNRLLREESRRYDDDPFLKLQNYATSRFIYDETSNKVWDERNRQLIDLTHVDAIMSTQGKAMDITADRPKLVTYSYKHLLMAPSLRQAQGMRFQPDAVDTFFLDNSNEPPAWRINKFHPDDVPEAIKGDVSIMHEVLASLCRDSPAAIQKILIILARHAQFPAHTPKYGIMLTGEPRAGKSNFARLCGLALSKKFHSTRADLRSSFNSTWKGFACKEWPEFDKDMDEEWLKDLITSETYEVQTKYGMNYVERNYTLNIFTCNGLKSKLQEGDGRFVIAGYAKPDNKRLGLEFEKWVTGPGPNYFRYYLLNEVDCSEYDTMSVWTEAREAVIEASQSFRATVKDEILELIEDIVPNLECIPNNILSILLEPYKINTISFNKEFGQYFVKPKLEIINCNGVSTRFRAFKNLDYWRNHTHTADYRAQYEMAEKLIHKSKF